MPDYGATPEARALRIRAGVMLPFWQRLYHLAEDVDDDRARSLLDVCRGAIVTAEILLHEPDSRDLKEAVEQLEAWTASIERPAAAGLAAVLRTPIRDRRPRENPGPVSEFLKGAFLAWLRRRRDGEELSLCVEDVDDRRAVQWTVATAQQATGGELWSDEIPVKARAAGAQAVRKAFKEVRG